ncbi:HigA family addiction module antitoxin [Geobacter benzoatilyticus]|jgi:addiction module HigA family antidote|uniref:HigA family addiction module antidote protein n=1 Tax=Geobacter benzoatilyticus TaxID=2815309 RepID=A0ABX7Q3D7_9BACT|nr:HigA family addiction module antitoxin [Geobacter benzoatilyticus]QSV45899.1 HigA family addiction module antidote protein [Geobacter benzoatilyticus]
MATKNGLPPIHPGVFLKEILDELGISQNAFAQAIGVSPMRVSHVIKGTRPVTAELALLFGKAFGQTPIYWMNLQTSYDLKTVEKELAPKVRQVHPLSRAA